MAGIGSKCLIINNLQVSILLSFILFFILALSPVDNGPAKFIAYKNHEDPEAPSKNASAQVFEATGRFAPNPPKTAFLGQILFRMSRKKFVDGFRRLSADLKRHFDDHLDLYSDTIPQCWAKLPHHQIFRMGAYCPQTPAKTFL